MKIKFRDWRFYADLMIPLVAIAVIVFAIASIVYESKLHFPFSASAHRSGPKASR